MRRPLTVEQKEIYEEDCVDDPKIKKNNQIPNTFKNVPRKKSILKSRSRSKSENSAPDENTPVNGKSEISEFTITKQILISPEPSMCNQRRDSVTSIGLSLVDNISNFTSYSNSKAFGGRKNSLDNRSHLGIGSCSSNTQKDTNGLCSNNKMIELPLNFNLATNQIDNEEIFTFEERRNSNCGAMAKLLENYDPAYKKIRRPSRIITKLRVSQASLEENGYVCGVVDQKETKERLKVPEMKF